MKKRNRLQSLTSIFVCIVFVIFGSYIPVKALGLTFPGNITAESTDTSITLSWDHVAGSVGYEVEINGVQRETVMDDVYQSQEAAGSNLGNVLGNGSNAFGKVSYVSKNLTPNTMYSYRVRTLSSLGIGEWSSVIKKTTLPKDDHGLRGEYYGDGSFGALKLTRTDRELNFDWKKDTALNNLSGPISVRWKGQIEPAYSEQYSLCAKTLGKVRLWINNKLVIDKPLNTDGKDFSGIVNFSAGKRYDMAIEYNGEANTDGLALLWSSQSVSEQIIPSTCLFTPVVPSAPENISAIPTGNSIKLSWNKANGATGYIVEENGIEVGKCDDNQCTRNDLLPVTEYKYRIKATNLEGSSEWSEYFTAKTGRSENNIGLKGEYFNDKDLSNFVLSRIDPVINFNWMLWTPDPRIDSSQFSVRWTGQIKPRYSENYTFYAKTDDGVRLWINGKLIIDKWRSEQETEWKGKIKLEANKKYNIQMEYYQSDLFASAKLSWSSQSQQKEIIPQSQLYPSIVQPGVPQNIKTSSAGDAITISWDEVEGAEGYELEINGVVMDNEDSTTYTQKGLVANAQKVYRVRTKTQTGVSDWSSYIIGTTLSGVPENINAAEGSTSINLSWDSVGRADSYDVEIDGKVIEGIAATNYIFSDLDNDSLHKFRVRANSSSGNGEWSKVIEGRTLLSKPQNVKLEPSGNTLAVSWDKVTNATEYEVEVDGQIVKNTAAAAVQLEGFDANTSHIVRVRAKNAHGVSQWSEEANGTTNVGTPDNITGQPDSNSITLNWNEVSGAIGYDVEANGQIVETATVTSYVYNNLKPNTDYTLRVRARSLNGIGAWSNPVTIKTLPEKLKGVKLTTKSNQIIVEWTPTPDAEGYEVEADGQLIDVGNVTSYIHMGLEPKTQHVYRVKTKINGTGKWSEPITGWTIFTPPANLKAVPQGNSMYVSWDTVEGATYYELDMDNSFEKNSNNPVTDSVTGTVYSGVYRTANTFYLQEGLLFNSMHTYRVRAICGDEVSEWSQVVESGASTDRPEKLEGVSTPDSITLAWSEVKNAIGYELEIDGQVVDVGNVLTYTHSGLSAGSVHTYRVRAKNASGFSDWSEALVKKTSGGVVAECQSGDDFNFIIMIPYDKNLTQRTVTVNYNPGEADVKDLCAITTAIETSVGKVEGTNITITKFDSQNGVIEFTIDNPTTAVIDSIKFVTKVSGFVRIVYVVR